MNEMNADNVINAEPALDMPRRLSIVSPKSLTDDDLMRVHMLAGEARETFLAACTKEDLFDRSRPQLIAAADVPNWFDGPPSVRRIVGLARGRIVQIELGQRPYWSLESMHVDLTVEQEKVREFLMRQIMERARRRKGVEGVRVVVPPSDTETTVHYMQKGFRDAPAFDTRGALLWTPTNRRFS